MRLVLGCFLLFLFLNAEAQIPDSSLRRFRAAEQELKALQKKTFFSRSDQEKLEGNKAFIEIWDRVVSDPSILDYPFDSLREISILRPGNHELLIVSWNIPRADGSHNYFGYLLVNSSHREKTGFLKHRLVSSYDHYKLMDRSATVKSPESFIGSPDKWFGMLYTDLVECDDYYLLLGWDGNDKLTQRKFLDVLYFKSNGDAVFGKDVFRFPRRSPRRLMFECSQEVSMSLRYNKKQNQIIYSHLGPKQEGGVMEGQFQFYGPDGSFDALELKKDKWVPLEDVDARNDRSKKDGEYNNPKNPRQRKNKKFLPASTPTPH
jgi:hypothetical protein